MLLKVFVIEAKTFWSLGLEPLLSQGFSFKYFCLLKIDSKSNESLKLLEIPESSFLTWA